MPDVETYKVAIRHLSCIHFVNWEFAGIKIPGNGYVSIPQKDGPPELSYFSRLKYVLVKPDGDIIINAWWRN